MNSRFVLFVFLFCSSPIVADEQSELQESITAALVSATKDTDASVRLAAYTALKALPQSGSITAAFRLGADDENVPIRMLALSRLVAGLGPTDEVLDRLIRELGQPDSGGTAMKMLIGIGEPAVPKLINAVENNTNGKLTAAYILGKVDLGKYQKETIACISALLKDKDSRARSLAIEVLEDIAARKFEKVDDDKLNWQECSVGSLGYAHSVHRSRVPGGWLVVLTGHYPETQPSITFYADPRHEWDGTSID